MWGEHVCHSNILQVHKHPTNIQYRIQVQTLRKQIHTLKKQVQTPYTYKIHKRHAPKIQGYVVVFFRKKEPATGSWTTGVLGGILKSMEIDNIQKIHAQYIQGCDFPEENKTT